MTLLWFLQIIKPTLIVKKVSRAYLDQKNWTKMSILNVARMGKFSSDRAIQEYLNDIWKAKPVPVIDKDFKDSKVVKREPGGEICPGLQRNPERVTKLLFQVLAGIAKPFWDQPIIQKIKS